MMKKKKLQMTLQQNQNDYERIVFIIEKNISDMKFRYDKNDLEHICVFDIYSDNVYGCQVVIKKDNYIEILPFIESNKRIYSPSKSKTGDVKEIIDWFSSNFIHSMYLIKNFSQIITNVCEVIKKSGFDGICLPSVLSNKNNSLFQVFELCNTYKGIKKTLFLDIKLTENGIKVFIENEDNGKKLISSDRNSKTVLSSISEEVKILISQYNPSLKHYLLLLKNPDYYGEKIAVFPLKNTEFEI